MFFGKVFDTCQYENMKNVFTARLKNISIITNLNWGQKETVRVKDQYTEPVQIQKISRSLDMLKRSSK